MRQRVGRTLPRHLGLSLTLLVAAVLPVAGLGPVAHAQDAGDTVRLDYGFFQDEPPADDPGILPPPDDAQPPADGPPRQPGPPRRPAPGEWRFRALAGAAHIFDTNIDNGGKFNLTQVWLGLGATIGVSEDIDVKIFGRFELDDYRFDDITVPGPGGSLLPIQPWNDINNIGLIAAVTFDPAPRWTVTTGPIFAMSWENGASASDGIQWGWLAGAGYAFSENLVLGGGVGVVSQIEDNVRFFPVLQVYWKINDALAITNRRETGGGPLGGVELVWSVAKGFELGLGANYEFRRFRLNGDGPFPNGVGEDERFPIWLRASWLPSRDFRLDLQAGVIIGGKLKLDDEFGNSIAEESYDITPGVALSGQIRF